jgi:glucokinase
MNLLNKGILAVKELGKGIPTKQNGMTAVKVLGGVAIGITAAILGTDKKEKMFGGRTQVRNNKKIAAIGTGIGLGTVAVVAAKNAIPRVKAVFKTVAHTVDAVE